MVRDDSGIQITPDASSSQDRLVSHPTTRYQGSKKKIIGWIKGAIRNLEFDKVLDCFGGTGVVSHMFKTMGKSVTFNDYLQTNYIMAKALIENKEITLTEDKLKQILKPQNIEYKRFIQDTFDDIYFTSEENMQLDIIVQNIHRMTDEYEQAIAFFSLFQSCIIKRPYNLFHRKNLYMRTNDVPRSFGNKTTWDRSFEEYMLQFTREANAAVFDNGCNNRLLNKDVFEVEQNNYDLVYIDPPYVSPKGVGVDYRDFYHFLEGIVNYENWQTMIDWNSKHRRLKLLPNPWTKPATVRWAFERLFTKFQDSMLLVSYRSPGIPTRYELCEILESLGKRVEVLEQEHQYVLSKPRRKSSEILIIAK